MPTVTPFNLPPPPPPIGGGAPVEMPTAPAAASASSSDSVVGRTFAEPEQQKNNTVNELDAKTALSLQFDGKDRTQWRNLAMKNNPHIQQLRERLYPLERAVTFGHTYNVGQPEVKESLSRKQVLQLILEHLQYEGLRNSVEVLESEARIQASTYTQKKSVLIHIIKTAVRESESVYDKTLGQRVVDQETHTDELVEELLTLGVEEDVEDESDDINIWEADKLEENNVIMDDSEEGEIKAATLNKLVERLTSNSQYGVKYIRTFLLTYQSFTTPRRLLGKLIQRYHVPRPAEVDDEEEWLRSEVRPTQLRVCSVLKNWLQNHFADFNEKLLGDLNLFLEGTLTKDGYSKLAGQLQKVIQKEIKGRSESRETMFSTAPPAPSVPKHIFSSTLTLDDIDEIEVARQMTIITFEMYRAIQASEFLNQAWSKAKYKHRARHVLALIGRFNDVSNWAANCVIKEEKIKNRTRMMHRFVKIALHLHNLNNFNEVMAIIAGLNNSAVHRLKHTRGDIPQRDMDKYHDLEQLMSSESNAKRYREHLHSSDPPCIPYLGVYLTDLTFIDDGNPNMIEGLINFKKRRLLYNVILEIQQYQQRPYNLLEVQQIKNFLVKFPKFLSEDEMYRMSLKVEPRGKDRDEIE